MAGVLAAGLVLAGIGITSIVPITLSVPVRGLGFAADFERVIEERADSEASA